MDLAYKGKGFPLGFSKYLSNHLKMTYAIEELGFQISS